MQKRFYLGVGILAALLVLGLLIGWAMESTAEPVARLLEQAAVAEDPQRAAMLIRQAQTRWRAAWPYMALAADHSPMDEIDSLFAQLEYYEKAQLPAAVGAGCARLAELVEAVGEAHRLTWWNLL